MGNYQKFRGDPEQKLFYLLSNFMGGINTEFSDDNSNDVDFESIINFDMDKLGTLNKRGGFGELTAISEIFNTLPSEDLPNIKNRTERTPNPENENDNVVYMKLLRNDNNCFRALSGFSGEEAYKKYQDMYGFQNNQFTLLMITTSLVDGVETSSKAWLYHCELPERIIEEENDETVITETMVFYCCKTELPVIFKWDRNLMNIETIEFYDKIYFTGNDKCLITFDRSAEITSDSDLANAFTYSGTSENLITNSAHVPSGLEIRHIGFNVLCDDPMHSINTQGITTDSIQGLYVCTTDNIPLLSLPLGQKFLLNIMYTGNDNGFSIEMKEGDKTLTFEIEENSSLSQAGLKVYEVKFKDVPSGEVEIKITKTGADALEPYYDYYDVAQPDKEAKVVQQLNVGDYGICEMYNRAVYYKDDTIWFSDVNNFSYIPNYNYVTLPIEPTDKITKICYFKKAYIIFTKQRIYKMTGSFGTSDFAVSPVNTSLGCHAGNTVVPIEDTLYFSSPRGLYALRSSQFVEGFENVKELDLKVKKLTSDFTKYSEELEDPAIRFNGVSERAYALRYRDKYLLFYNNYNDKGDYAAVNGLDVLAYQFDIGAYTTYRFKEKPTFLFMVDSAIETLATVAQKEIFTEEETLLEYNFDSGSLEDLSGNDNDAIMQGNLGINQGVGVELDGQNSHLKIDRFTGDIENGFDINLETKCDVLKACTLINLQQSEEAALGTSGSFETGYVNGYKATFDYTITPDTSNNTDIVEYKLIYSREATSASTGQVVYSLDGILPSKTVPFNLSDTTSKVIDSGTFIINRTSEGTYSSVWKLNINSTYTVVTTSIENIIGSPVNLTKKYYDTSLSWIKLGFNSFKATVDENGVYTITYTPAVKNTGRLSVGKRTLVVTIDGEKYNHNVPAIEGTGTTSAGERTIKINSGFASKNEQLTRNTTIDLTIKVSMQYNIKATLSKKYTASVSTKSQSVKLPSLTKNIVTNSITEHFNMSASSPINLLETYESYRQIILRQTEQDQLVFELSNEYGDFQISSPTNIGLLERHVWAVTIGDDDYGNYTCSIYRDEEVLVTENIDSKFLINANRDLCLIGTDPEYNSYYDGKIYNINITNPTETLMNFSFIEGTGDKTYDTSSEERVATFIGNTQWVVENGIIFDGENGYLELPVFGENVYFTNGFKIEFEGTIGNLNNFAKIIDLATSYGNDNNKNNNCSINLGVNGGVLSFGSTSFDYKTYKVLENSVDLTTKHRFILDCVDNGNTGYNISFIVDGMVIAIDMFNYGGITNTKRTSNFIGKSNTTTDNLFKGILNNFKIIIYASESGVPVYRSALYEFDTTSTDFGRPLYLELKTKAINMKYPQHLKKLKHIFVKAIGGYNYGELFFTLYGDGYIVNDPKTYSYFIDEFGTVTQEYKENKDLTIDEKISLLGNMRLDKTRLGEGTYQTRKLIIPKKAKNFAILISGDSSDYISLESIGYVCKLGKVKES